MKKLENKCMLITYSDSMGHNLADLNEILDKYFKSIPFSFVNVFSF